MSGWVSQVRFGASAFRWAAGVAAVGALAAACGGSAGAETTPAAGTHVEDHVHGAVAGPKRGSLLIATHYGLATSTNDGRSWTANGGLGDEMIAGIVKTGSTYVASLQMMPGMSMPDLHGGPMTDMQMSGTQMPGMKMSASTMPNIAYSNDSKTWSMPSGLPAEIPVASLTAGTSRGTAWASLLGRGVYETQDNGHSWVQAVPASVPISVVDAVGPNLLMATPSGLFVTATTGPSMPGLPQLQGPINDLTSIPGCTRCVLASLGRRAVAISHTAGVTWKRFTTPTTFDEVYATRGSLFGLVPSSADPDHGVWRSTDGGRSWHRVLTAPLVDHLYAAPGPRSSLLAFEWGIKVYRSIDDGKTWSLRSRIGSS